MDRERSAEQQHIAVPTTVPFTFLKPSERRCSWRTGKFPYRSEHELARHLSDAQTRVCVWMYRKFPGRIGKWAQSFLHRSPWGFRIIMCVCVCVGKAWDWDCWTEISLNRQNTKQTRRSNALIQKNVICRLCIAQHSRFWRFPLMSRNSGNWLSVCCQTGAQVKVLIAVKVIWLRRFLWARIHHASHCVCWPFARCHTPPRPPQCSYARHSLLPLQLIFRA